jgi:hypothetical protein
MVVSTSSEPKRNAIMDHLLTPENAALVVVDYQPTQVSSIKSMEHDKLSLRTLSPSQRWRRRIGCPLCSRQ